MLGLFHDLQCDCGCKIQSEEREEAVHGDKKVMCTGIMGDKLTGQQPDKSRSVRSNSCRKQYYAVTLALYARLGGIRYRAHYISCATEREHTSSATMRKQLMRAARR